MPRENPPVDSGRDCSQSESLPSAWTFVCESVDVAELTPTITTPPEQPERHHLTVHMFDRRNPRSMREAIAIVQLPLDSPLPESLNALEGIRAIIDDTSYYRCIICRTFHTRMYHDNLLCSGCTRTYDICFHCKTIFPREELTYDSSQVGVCQQCLPRATRCSICGGWTEGAGTCSPCRESLIHSCSYKPHPQFLPAASSSLFLGVELETDDYPTDNNDNMFKTYLAASKLQTLSDKEKFFYLKADGTLENGIEIVTQPATLDYHRTEFPWQEIIAVVQAHGGKSHDAGTCGLHVHFNVSYLGRTELKQEMNTLKLLYMIERFWSFWVRFSRRNDRSLDEFACRYGRTFKNASPDKIKELKGHESRYRAVNVLNNTTVEIRIFKGTLIIETLFATLEMVDYLVNYIKTHDTTDIYKLTWTKFVGSIGSSEYPSLVKYLQEHKLRGKNKCA